MCVTTCYTHLRSKAMHADPEAISRDAQDDLSWRARQRELVTWQTARDRILADIQHIAAHIHSPTSVAPPARWNARSPRSTASSVDEGEHAAPFGGLTAPLVAGPR